MKRKIIALSPHLDDVTLSCGEYIEELINEENAKVEVVTIFAKSPSKEDEISELAQKFSAEWNMKEEAVKVRKREDKNSMKELQVKCEYMPMLECLYRRNQDGKHKYLKEFGEIYEQDYEKEKDTIKELKERFTKIIREKNITTVISPLGIGRHIDHLITRKAIEEINKEINFELLYYEDMPYVGFEKDKNWEQELTAGLEKVFYKITEEEWQKKMNAVNCYTSQLKMLWGESKEEEEQYAKISHRQSKDFRSIRIWTKK